MRGARTCSLACVKYAASSAARLGSSVVALRFTSQRSPMLYSLLAQ